MRLNDKCTELEDKCIKIKLFPDRYSDEIGKMIMLFILENITNRKDKVGQFYMDMAVDETKVCCSLCTIF